MREYICLRCLFIYFWIWHDYYLAILTTMMEFCDLDNSVFLLCYFILQRYFLNRWCISSMLFYFTKIFLNYLNRRPPLHGLSCWHGLPCLAWCGLPCLAGTCLAWICVVMYFWNFGTVITCLSQTPTHVLPCWHGFVRKTRFATLGTDLLVLYYKLHQQMRKRHFCQKEWVNIFAPGVLFISNMTW